MEQILISILELISQEIPELSLVDEDYGQLETEEDTYPVTFPCVLIGNMEADWEDIGLGAQKGIVTFTARLAIDCYDDTHIKSGTTEKVAKRLQPSLHNATRFSTQRQHGTNLPDKKPLLLASWYDKSL